MKIKTSYILIAFATLFLAEARAQDFLSGTRVSQRASITQRIGTTDITLVYHSPLAGEREVFGSLVPFDFVVDGVEYPWRAGANENTTVEVTHDVMIQGKALPKGTYGLHILIGKGEWTWIFSRSASKWGSFGYKKEEDALRVTAKPQKADYQDWLSYDFRERQPGSVSLQLNWAGQACAIPISTDVNSNVLADLSAKEEKTIQDYLVMANRSLMRNPEDTGMALAYLDTSLMAERNFSNLMFKSIILEKAGRVQESAVLKKEALSMGEGFPYFYYYPLGFLGEENGHEKALTLLSDMVAQQPENYIVHLALAEYYFRTGDQLLATRHFKKAFENAPEEAEPYARYMYLVNAVRGKGGR